MNILGVLFILLGLSGCGSQDQGPNTIKIGAIFSVSGPASFLGEPEKNTVLLLQEQINQKGGLLGKQLELVIYDDETDVNKCVLAADKLLKKDGVVAVVGPTTSGNTLSIVSKFAEAKIPLISCAAAEKIVVPVQPWIFKTAPSDRHAILKILNHVSAQGFKKIAILTVSDAFGEAGRVVLKELIPAKGFELVADESYGPKDTDMTAQLTKIKSQKPDAIICWGTNPGPAVVAKNRVQLGLSIPLYMSHGVASKKFIELAGEASDGLFLPAGRLIVTDQIPDTNPQKALLAQFIKDYDVKYKAPVSTFGGHAWDAFMVTIKAIEMGQSAKPEDIRNNLEKLTDFLGTAGTFKFSASDHCGLDETGFEMIVIEKGNWKIVP